MIGMLGLTRWRYLQQAVIRLLFAYPGRMTLGHFDLGLWEKLAGGRKVSR